MSTWHLSLLERNIPHTLFCTCFLHLKYFRMYCLPVGIEQSYIGNTEFIARRLILTFFIFKILRLMLIFSSLKKLRYNLYTVKFTLFSIQFCKFWQTHTFLCNFEKYCQIALLRKLNRYEYLCQFRCVIELFNAYQSVGKSSIAFYCIKNAFFLWWWSWVFFHFL